MDDMRLVDGASSEPVLSGLEDVNDKKQATKKMLMPTDSKQRQLCNAIMRRVALEMRAYGFNINPDLYDVYTMSVFYVKSAILHINTVNEKYHGERNEQINICDMIYGKLRNREDDHGEKTGNIILVLDLLPEAEEYLSEAEEHEDLKNPVPNSKRYETPSEEDIQTAKHYQDDVVKAMATRDLTLSSKDWKIYTFVKIFIRSALLEVLLQGSREGHCEFDIGEEFKIIAAVLDDDEGSLIMTLKPVVEGKITPKSDGETESE